MQLSNEQQVALTGLLATPDGDLMPSDLAQKKSICAQLAAFNEAPNREQKNFIGAKLSMSLKALKLTPVLVAHLGSENLADRICATALRTLGEPCHNPVAEMARRTGYLRMVQEQNSPAHLAKLSQAYGLQ